MSENQESLSREERIEEFGEEYVEHTDWWAEEMKRVEDIFDEVFWAVKERDDTQLAKRGTSVNQNGEHELRFTVRVAGEPWNPDNGDTHQDQLHGEVEQTIATLRGEADELASVGRTYEIYRYIEDTIEQLRHRADKLEENCTVPREGGSE